MSQPSFIQSFSGRLIMLGVIPAVLTIAGIVTWSGVDAYRSMHQTVERGLASDVVDAAAELSSRNDRFNHLAEIMAMSQVNGMFGRRKESSELAKSIVSGSPLSLGAFFVYEPNADGQDAASLKSGEIPKDAIDAAGRFLPVWYREPSGTDSPGPIKLKPSIGMEAMDYYVLPKSGWKRSGGAVATITEPYEKEPGVLLVSHVSPIVIRGEFVGVAGINRNLQGAARVLADMKKRSGADVFVLSPTGKFIAATTDLAEREAGDNAELQARALADTPFAAIGPRWQSAKLGGGAATFLAEDPVLGEECFYVSARTGIGGWTVVARRPKAEVMHDTHMSILRNSILGALGAILVGGLGLYVIRNVVSLVGNVKQAGIRLNSTATEIAATSRQQEASSATFGAASNQIAAAVKEISATGRDLVNTMESVSRMAGETASLAGVGQTGLQAMEGVMRDLDGATASIAEKLNSISERSQKINTVVTTITKVADQTNILSINAAIEAEKAGEYGAGFLVIAREIRRLADQTASATLDIEQMVQQMQGAVSSGVMEMDRFADQVRRGVREVTSAGATLTEIIDRVNRSTGSFGQVNESVQAQSQGAQQISDAMSSLVGNANQTVQSARELSRAAADLQSAIGLLREAVAQFKLRES